MTIDVLIKSGTGGYYDYDGCSFRVLTIKDNEFPIPRIGETISIMENCDDGRKNQNNEILQEYHDYLITDVKYWFAWDKDDKSKKGVEVYVVPIGRELKY